MSKENSPVNWYDNFLFEDESLVFEFIRLMGQVYFRGADIGECVLAARKIKQGDDLDWYNVWKETGEMVENMAEGFNKENHKISARHAYFRASSYYRTAGFYLHNPEGIEKALATWRKSVDCFLKAIESLPNIEPVEIPYKDTTMPGYFLKGDGTSGKAPLLLLQTGFDGTGEELYFGPGIAAQERGYHCLIFEGPGQGAMIREKKIPFRHDWEKVVTPLVDYALTRNDVDKDNIALMGLSMGGYLVPRAAAFEHRLKACVANGGVFDFAAPLYGMFSQELLEKAEADPESFNREVRELMKNSTGTRWFMNNGMYTFGVDTPAEFLILSKKYNMEGIANRIQCHTLIVDTEDDIFSAGQAEKLYKQLQCPKDFLVFTREQAAQAHCQSSALAISAEKVFNWLDEVMGK